MRSAVLYWVAGTEFVLVLHWIDKKLLYWESTLELLVKLDNSNNWIIEFVWDGRFLDERMTFEIKNNRPPDTLRKWYQFGELCRLERINRTLLLHGFVLLQTSWYCYGCLWFIFVNDLLILRYVFRIELRQMHILKWPLLRFLGSIIVSAHRYICLCWLLQQYKRLMRRYTQFTVHFHTTFHMGYQQSR
jgi:hypothetical protein